jgi:hypothetical protein
MLRDAGQAVRGRSLAAPERFKGRDSPAECTGIIKTRVSGDPDMTQGQHVLRRARQPEYQNALSQDDEADECVLKEDGKPRARDGASLDVLQSRPHS